MNKFCTFLELTLKGQIQMNDQPSYQELISGNKRITLIYISI